MRKLWCILLTVSVLTALLLGCTPREAAAPAASEQRQEELQPQAKPSSAASGGYTIAFVNCSLNETWRRQMVAEFEQKADELKEAGVIREYYETNAYNNASKQVRDMEDMIAMGVDGILLAAVNSAALNDVIDRAVDQGIKVVNFNSLTDSDRVTAKVYQSDYEFGRICARFLVDKLEGKGKLLVLNGTAGNSVSDARWSGAYEVFRKYPEIEIVGEAYGEWDYEKGRSATLSLLESNPVVDAVYSQGGAMTQGAVDAFIEAGRPLVPMSGESGNGYLRTWMKYMGVDKFDSVAPVYTSTVSVTALETLIDALDGKSVTFDNQLEMEALYGTDAMKLYRPDLSDDFWCDTQLTEENLNRLYGLEMEPEPEEAPAPEEPDGAAEQTADTSEPE